MDSALDRAEQIAAWRASKGGSDDCLAWFNAWLIDSAYRTFRSRGWHSPDTYPADLVEEALQEASVAFWERYDPNRAGASSPLVYFIAIARNRLSSKIASWNKYHNKLIRYHSNARVLVGLSESVGERVAVEEYMARLRECLGKLPRETREVVIDLTVGEYKKKAYAERVGRSCDWVGARHSEGLRLLKECIETQSSRAGRRKV